MVDLTDPIGPAARLFEDEFYALCERSLRADGFLVAQTESIHFHPDVVRSCFTALAGRFAHTDLLWTAIATYPGAFWTFGIASKRSIRGSCGAGPRSRPGSTTSTPTTGSSSRARCGTASSAYSQVSTIGRVRTSRAGQ